MPSKARIVVGVLLAVAVIFGTTYAVWGDWDRGRIVGAERVVVESAGAAADDGGRAEFEAALEQRFRELTPAQHAETCDSFRAVGLEDSLAYIRERHYTQPGGPRMPFFDDIAVEILGRECALLI